MPFSLAQPFVNALRIKSITVNMDLPSGPVIRYEIALGNREGDVFTQIAVRRGQLTPEQGANFVAAFASIEPQFLAFLASIGAIPAIQNPPGGGSNPGGGEPPGGELP